MSVPTREQCLADLATFMLDKAEERSMTVATPGDPESEERQ